MLQNLWLPTVNRSNPYKLDAARRENSQWEVKLRDYNIKHLVLLTLTVYIINIINESFVQVFCLAPNSWRHFDQFHISAPWANSRSFWRRAGSESWHLSIGPSPLGDWAIWIPIRSSWSNWWQYFNSLNKLQVSSLFRQLHTCTKPAFQVDVVQPTVESPRIIFLLPFPRCHEDPHLHLDRVVKLAGIGKS